MAPYFHPWPPPFLHSWLMTGTLNFSRKGRNNRSTSVENKKPKTISWFSPPTGDFGVSEDFLAGTFFAPNSKRFCQDGWSRLPSGYNTARDETAQGIVDGGAVLQCSTVLRCYRGSNLFITISFVAWTQPLPRGPTTLANRLQIIGPAKSTKAEKSLFLLKKVTESHISFIAYYRAKSIRKNTYFSCVFVFVDKIT